MKSTFLVLAIVSALSSASFGQPAGVAANISCTDFLKAEQASGWSNGMTGSPSADQTSAADARRIHEFCVANPQENAAIAIEKTKQDPPRDAAGNVR